MYFLLPIAYFSSQGAGLYFRGGQWLSSPSRRWWARYWSDEKALGFFFNNHHNVCQCNCNNILLFWKNKQNMFQWEHELFSFLFQHFTAIDFSLNISPQCGPTAPLWLNTTIDVRCAFSLAFPTYRLLLPLPVLPVCVSLTSSHRGPGVERRPAQSCHIPLPLEFS